MTLCGRALLAIRVEQQDLQQTDYLNATKTRTKGQEWSLCTPSTYPFMPANREALAGYGLPVPNTLD